MLDADVSAWRDEVHIEFFGVNSMMTTTASVRKGRFKYTWNCSSRDDLYDLERDPHEMQNLIDDAGFATVLREMRESLERWMVDSHFPGVGLYRRSRMGQFPY